MYNLMYNLISFDIPTQSWNYHSNQSNEHIYFPQLSLFFFTVPFLCPPNTPQQITNDLFCNYKFLFF